MDAKIGFVGLGVMGKGIAINILKSGYSMTVFDVVEESVNELKGYGANAAESLKEIAEACDWIMLCLPDTEIVKKVLWGKNGLVDHLPEKRIIIDCGTTHPLATKDFYKQLKAKGIHFLDAPVSGMAERAMEGTLTVMAGGNKKIYETVKPVLESMSKTLVYMGETGSGQLAKVINNVFFNISCAAVAELLPTAVKMGLDPIKMVEVAGTGTGQSFALNFFGPLILERNFGPGYQLEKAYKDMVSISEVATTYSIPMPLTMSTNLTYRMAMNMGCGKENKGSMVKVWEKVLDVVVKK